MAFAAFYRGPTATLVDLQIRPAALPREPAQAVQAWRAVEASVAAAVPD